LVKGPDFVAANGNIEGFSNNIFCNQFFQLIIHIFLNRYDVQNLPGQQDTTGTPTVRAFMLMQGLRCYN
jgi:hypothetical protein